ncbi:MAG: choice-of-anchor D domain-containing protein [Cytophaga sp.]|uniref:choice-of-anchor D domain-containing protein n=1 Tax=Cytophaga sp. TaxID=29535 RepID=UPI003F7DAABF
MNSIFKLSVLAYLFSFLSLSSHGQEVSTFAGLGNDADGPAEQASFSAPNDVVLDAEGNLYVADWANHKIRKITPQGMVSTLAGNGTQGYLDATGADAMFNSPKGLAIDKDGNLFVAEYGGRKIRKVTPQGVVTTIASSPPVGPQIFYNPTDLVVDNSGNIYVTNMSVVTKTTPDGQTSIFAGAGYGFQDGPGNTAKFKDLTGITLGTDGNLYVADNGNHRIRKITFQGEVSTFTGSVSGSQNGDLSIATFSRPYGITTDKDGNMYVSEENNIVIRKISSTGQVSKYAGVVGSFGWADGPADQVGFNYPHGLTVDNSGNVIVADQGNNKIRKISPQGIVSTVAGVVEVHYAAEVDGTGTLARFRNPAGTAVDGLGNVYIADETRVRKITPEGTVTTLAGNPYIGTQDGTGANARFYEASGITVNAAGNVFVADLKNHNIRKITPAGVVTTIAGSSGTSGYADGNGLNARFNNPSALVLDASGNLYVTDQMNYCIRKITPNGDVTTFAGTNISGYQDGNGIDARFSACTGITIDKAGNLYVVSGNRIRKITPQAEVSTFAGAGSQGSANGVGTKATFYSPYGICIDASGNLYVSQIEGDNNLIRKITPQAVVTTLAGTGLAGSANGPGATASFNYPAGIAVDKDYNIYIADQYNYKIRKITLHNEIKVLHDNNELISGSSEVDFGTVEVGKFNVFSFSIENAVRALKPVTLLGDPTITVSSNDFIIEQASNSTLVEAGTPATFTITFKPGTVGDKTATVTIVNDDLDEGNYTFEIVGVASAPTVTTGITDSKSSSVICYPNPASSQVTLNIAEDMMLEIYTSTGIKLITQQMVKGENLVNIENLPAGLYFFYMPSIDQIIKVIKD